MTFSAAARPHRGTGTIAAMVFDYLIGGTLVDGTLVDERGMPGRAKRLARLQIGRVYPIGFGMSIVSGRLAVRDGAETGVRPGRLLRHES